MKYNPDPFTASTDVTLRVRIEPATVGVLLVPELIDALTEVVLQTLPTRNVQPGDVWCLVGITAEIRLS